MFQGWLGRFSVACWASLQMPTSTAPLLCIIFQFNDIADVGSLVVIIIASTEHQGPTPEPEFEWTSASGHRDAPKYLRPQALGSAVDKVTDSRYLWRRRGSQSSTRDGPQRGQIKGQS